MLPNSDSATAVGLWLQIRAGSVANPRPVAFSARRAFGRWVSDRGTPVVRLLARQGVTEGFHPFPFGLRGLVRLPWRVDRGFDHLQVVNVARAVREDSLGAHPY